MRRAVLARPGARRENGCAMIQPDFKTFSKLARQGNLVPVYENLYRRPAHARRRASAPRAQCEIFVSARKRRRRREHCALHLRRSESRRNVSLRADANVAFETGGKREKFTADPIELSAATHRTLPPRARPRPAAADRRRDRLFRLRHGAPDRKDSRERSRRSESRRFRDDVLSRPSRLRPRATPRLGDSQRFYRRQGKPAPEIQRRGARNPPHAPQTRKPVAAPTPGAVALAPCASNRISRKRATWPQCARPKVTSAPATSFR